MVKRKIKERSGRPSKLSPKTKQSMKNLAKEKIGVGIRKVAKTLKFTDDFLRRQKYISVSTVRRFVKSTTWGKHAYNERIKPMLSDKNEFFLLNLFIDIGYFGT